MTTVKDRCAQEYSNTTSFQDQRSYLEHALTTCITSEYSQKVYAHVRTIEELYWETDLLLDEEEEVRRLLQNVSPLYSRIL